LDGAPLFIDDANERVGINTTAPDVPLDIVGSLATQDSVLRLESLDRRTNIVLKDSDTTNDLLLSCVGDDFRLRTGGSDRVTVDSSGAVGIGTTSPSYKLDVNGTVNASSRVRVGGEAGLYLTGTTIEVGSAGGGRSLSLAAGASDRLFINSSGNVGIGTTSPSQKLQVQGNILVNGDLLIEGYTNPSQPAGNIHSYASSSRSAWSSAATSDGSTRYHMRFASPSYPTCGWIYTRNGNVYYVNNSDYRLKENIVPLTGASERVMQLQPCTFNRINSPGVVDEGFIAHEVQAVVPTAICGDKDEVDEEGNPVYQGIDQSKMIPLLTAALQEALTTIDQLTARIEALEAG